MRIRRLGLSTALICAAACGDAGPQDTSGGVHAAAPIDDPGTPAQLFGPKCSVKIDGAPAAHGCISAVHEVAGGRTHLFLNFCVRNGEDLCASRDGVPETKAAPPYVSLVLPLTGWKETHVSQALRGRISVTAADGRRYQTGASEGRPLPISYRIVNQGHPTVPDALRAVLEVDVPPADGAGQPMRLEATVN
jgi:hypothetical protein